jgi:hypothetical protein
LWEGEGKGGGGGGEEERNLGWNLTTYLVRYSIRVLKRIGSAFLRLPALKVPLFEKQTPNIYDKIEEVVHALDRDEFESKSESEISTGSKIYTYSEESAPYTNYEFE